MLYNTADPLFIFECTLILILDVHTRLQSKCQSQPAYRDLQKCLISQMWLPVDFPPTDQAVLFAKGCDASCQINCIQSIMNASGLMLYMHLLARGCIQPLVPSVQHMSVIESKPWPDLW